MILSWGWRLLGPLARALPLGVAYGLSAGVMRAVHAVWPSGRGAMQANLRHVLASKDAAVLARASRAQLRRYGELLVDEARLPGMTSADCFHALETEEWPLLDAVLAEQRPVVFALTRTRERLGMVVIDAERTPLAAYRALRRGQPLGVLFDRPVARDAPGVDVTMFGAACRLPAGMARMALACDARVAPLAMARLGRSFRFRPLVDFEFAYAPTGEREDDVRRLTQAVVDVHAGWIAAYPDQWYQFRSFFHGAAPS